MKIHKTETISRAQIGIFLNQKVCLSESSRTPILVTFLCGKRAVRVGANLGQAVLEHVKKSRKER